MILVMTRVMRSAVVAAATVVAMALGSGCEVDAVTAERVLEAQGFSDVHLTGWVWFGCGEGDDYTSGFRAKNARGQPVEGYVCCGVMKACTVRF